MVAVGVRRGNLGSNDSSNVIAYQGPYDLKYPILALAVAKIGTQVGHPTRFALNDDLLLRHD